MRSRVKNLLKKDDDLSELLCTVPAMNWTEKQRLPPSLFFNSGKVRFLSYLQSGRNILTRGTIQLMVQCDVKGSITGSPRLFMEALIRRFGDKCDLYGCLWIKPVSYQLT